MSDSPAIARVAVLGLGIMGGGMAGRLLDNGFSVAVYNRTPDRTAPFAARGAQAAHTAREAVDGAQVVISMVGDDTASRAVWLGPDGALAGAAPGAVLVECSTLTLAWVHELAALAANQGLAFIDAPVVGSKVAAAEGKLRLLVGGEAAAIERAEPALNAISVGYAHLGPVGAGATMKLINNMMAAVQATALSEGLVLAERAGLDMSKVAELIGDGVTGSPFVKNRMPRMIARNFDDVHFALRWMRKDMAYALQLGEALGTPLPTVAAAKEVYQMACTLGYGEADSSAVVEVYRQGRDPHES